MNRLLPLLAVVGFDLFLVALAAVAEEPTADDYIELWKPLVGTWKKVVVVDGKTVEGTSLFTLSRTKKCLVTYSEGCLHPASEAIHGYDPVAKQWKVTSYDADGGYAVEVVTVKDMKKGKVLGPDYSTTSEMVRHSKDGKKTTISATVKYMAYGEDRIEAISTDRKEDGQSRPDMKFVMERRSCGGDAK
jgi:hypothetical protein